MSEFNSEQNPADVEAVVHEGDADEETQTHRHDVDPEASADEADSEGQLSEVGALDPDLIGEPISPSDAVAGAPDGESGRADEGAAGPDGIPPEFLED